MGDVTTNLDSTIAGTMVTIGQEAFHSLRLSDTSESTEKYLSNRKELVQCPASLTHRGVSLARALNCLRIAIKAG